MAGVKSRRKTVEAVEVTEHPLMEPGPVEEPRCWGECPLDILLMLFEWLEPEDLMNCIQVNTYWRDAVNYLGLHRGIWKQLAQAGMVNKGIDLRRRANPGLSWRELYINYRRWHLVRHAELTWTYELSDRDIRYLHVYKDILIMESDEDYFKKYYHIKDRLEDVSKKLIDAGEAEIDGIQLELVNEHIAENGADAPDVAEENGSSEGSSEEREELSYMSDKMIKKLVTEAPFTRLLVLDEECYYMLNQQNILRCSKWDETNQRWLSYVLARYFMCNKSISDINVYNDDVYMLLKTGLVFKLDRAGRNFVPDRRFNTYITPAQFEVSRMIYGQIDSSIQRAGTLNIPDYGTGMKVMFQKVSVVVSETGRYPCRFRTGVVRRPLSCIQREGAIKIPDFGKGMMVKFQKVSVAVAVPLDMEFKINVDEKTGNIVIEYPGLTCATQHGDLLFLGFMDGKIEICIPNNLTENGGKCEISTNVQDCPGFPSAEDENPSIVAIEIYEDLNAQQIFVATHSAVYRLMVTHPQYVDDQIGLDKEFFIDE